MVIPRYISTSLKWKLRNNNDVTDYFAGDNENVNRPNRAAVKDIDIADILGQEYRYRQYQYRQL